MGDHLNKYKLLEQSLRDEIAKLERDLQYVTKGKCLLELQNKDFNDEVCFLRIALSEKIKEIEVLKANIVRHNIPGNHGFSGDDTNHKEQYLHAKKLESHLRNNLS